jgi:uncharacterized membrane protein
LAVIVCQTFYYYSRLPPIVASHFGFGGAPNGWSSKQALWGIYWAVAILVAFAFFILPDLLSRYAPESINIPNREYWLAPQRREQATRILIREMSFFGSATLLLLVLTFELAFEANLPGGAFSSRVMMVLLIAFLVLTVGWLIRLYRCFAKPPSEI